MPKDTSQTIENKLDVVIRLLQHLIALELSQKGVTYQMIAKRLHVATATVVEMLKGVEKKG